VAKKSAKAAKSSMDPDSWCSPRDVTDLLEQFFRGPVAMDPCSNPNSIVKARRALHAGGLHLDWDESVYKNEPYSKMKLWAPKTIIELNKNVEELVGLEQVATSTQWWRQLCGAEPVLHAGKELRPRQRRGARLLFTKRLKFIGDVGFGARFDSVLMYYGRRYAEFERTFRSLTRWSAWGR
jgi:DNA N-6-adenine-methyltransferase (Dam)